MVRQRSFWGWGYEGEGLSAGQRDGLARRLSEGFGTTLEAAEPCPASALDLPRPRLSPPGALVGLLSAEPVDRATHAYGRSYRDVVRGFRGEFPRPPDLVARPRSEGDVVSILDWCATAGASAIPYGGGSSVVGGVEAGGTGDERPVVTVDLGRLDRVLEVDRPSRAARIQAGVLGPALEDQLRPRGLTLRHFPQSFECSSLGGWVATRSGGHFATLYTHIDDFVESLRAVTPVGLLESRRLPGSGAGPSPDRLLLGSEGTLAVVTEAWMRLQDRPRWRAGSSARFARFEDGVAAARALSQSGLHPSNCRLLDATEAVTSGAGDGSAAVLLVAFESADHPVSAWLDRAVELCRDHGGVLEGPAAPGDRAGPGPGDPAADGPGRRGAAGAWRSAFMRAPYVRDALVSLGVICETFETAVTWDRFEDLHRSVTVAAREALGEVGAGAGWVTCRFTHVYPDGPAPYFSVLAPGRRGHELEQWAVVKEAAADAVISAGGTITHHHAVGRDHRRWYDLQRPQPFAEALRAAKAALDPDWILNPGVLVDPTPATAPATVGREEGEATS